MLTEQERESIRDFYGQQIKEMADGNIRQFLADRSLGYVVLGGQDDYLEIEPQEDLPNNSEPMDLYKVSGLPSAIRIKRPDSSTVPQSVVDSFNRHLWYSRYCLTDIRVVTFDVSDRTTFGIYIEGYVDDGWDNCMSVWEIYEAGGNFICSLVKGEDEWNFEGGLFTDENFGGAILPPPYTPELVAQSSSPIWISKYGGFWVAPLWSEEETSIVE